MIEVVDQNFKSFSIKTARFQLCDNDMSSFL